MFSGVLPLSVTVTVCSGPTEPTGSEPRLSELGLTLAAGPGAGVIVTLAASLVTVGPLVPVACGAR
jgi:hypothetical protein